MEHKQKDRIRYTWCPASGCNPAVAAMSSEMEKRLGECKYLKREILSLSNPSRQFSQIAALNSLP